MKLPAWVISIRNFQWIGLMFSRSIWFHFNRQQKLMNITREWILKGHFQWTINIWTFLETSNYIKMINLMKVTFFFLGLVCFYFHYYRRWVKKIFIVYGFPDSSVGKESTCNAGDPSLIPGSGRATGEGIGYPLQYSWASLVVYDYMFIKILGL